MDELEKGQRSVAEADISWGLEDPNDNSLTSWTGMIVGPKNTNFQQRMFFLNIKCGQEYPDVRPEVKFTSKIAMTCVAADGKVDHTKVPALRDWKRGMYIRDILIALRTLMSAPENAKLKQPPE
ncbi:unnamed protein product [Schistocephalus solidus]|uniref:UBC core domain-containing protein n=1 Tax=Schistocephalus solidus TaxID=70667 RepID=A0A3P7CUJ4_SCHSO|nr:unnamed protein product [Schistocephalus solidus]